MHGTLEAGELRSVHGNIGIALLRTEMVESADALTANGITIQHHLPDWNQ
jgi:hypothetical protein